ncbi:hypothetical protein MOV61_06620 [Neorhizobium sp. BETTINA12A]|uniref:hypothetical protein n=1 Tax=Neorhizobium sp. BETTINA12A TaxID=2908924 RepID=UPI001FF16608|nr:hypothetical protein [Neorhizobium sp. BETTINA12A]MCJ9750392.1 hypothetical protein [Neorhizobium sp. BETTINA12A]
MDESNIATAERKLVESIAKRIGVEETSVKKVLDHLGLNSALSNRVATGGKLELGEVNLRIAAGQVLR